MTFLVFVSISCENHNPQLQEKTEQNNNIADVNKKSRTDIAINENPYDKIKDIPAPMGFKRTNATENSFQYWLEHTPLKKDKTVYLFDGRKKQNQSAQFAVLDIPVGNKDLQQCADAVMRLRAMYLFAQKKFDSIIFYDNESRRYAFSQPYTADHFNNYLQTVFGMCGSASLTKQLKQKDFKEIQTGDVLIHGGFLGHAVIVMDVVVDKNGAKKYLLAQSYMPAQDIHVLINPGNADQSPWFDLPVENLIETPEYNFYKNELKGW